MYKALFVFRLRGEWGPIRTPGRDFKGNKRNN